MVSKNIVFSVVCILLIINPIISNSQIWKPDPRSGFISAELDSSTLVPAFKNNDNPKLTLLSKTIEQGQNLSLQFLIDLPANASVDVLNKTKAQCVRRQTFSNPISAGATYPISTATLRKGVYLLMVNKDPTLMIRFEVK